MPPSRECEPSLLAGLDVPLPLRFLSKLNCSPLPLFVTLLSCSLCCREGPASTPCLSLAGQVLFPSAELDLNHLGAADCGGSLQPRLLFPAGIADSCFPLSPKDFWTPRMGLSRSTCPFQLTGPSLSQHFWLCVCVACTSSASFPTSFCLQFLSVPDCAPPCCQSTFDHFNLLLKTGERQTGCRGSRELLGPWTVGDDLDCSAGHSYVLPAH